MRDILYGVLMIGFGVASVPVCDNDATVFLVMLVLGGMIIKESIAEMWRERNEEYIIRRNHGSGHTDSYTGICE